MKGEKAKITSVKKPKAIEHFDKEECQRALMKFADAERVAIRKMKTLSLVSS